MSDLYAYLNTRKGKAYLDSQIKENSLILRYPYIETSRKLRGNSRITGDADKEVQDAIIDMIITIAVRYRLNYKEISYILLTAKVECGFNPDAAAGTTSAAGLAQGTHDFLKDLSKHSIDILGFQLVIKDTDVFDAEKGCYALIYSFLFNKSKVMKYYTSDQSEYWEWLYLLHHDGAHKLDQYNAGIGKKSKDGQKWAIYIMDHLSVVEGLLKDSEVNTKFKLSTVGNTPFKNKHYIAAISPFPCSICPNLVSDDEKSLVFIKGVTDADGMTESVNAIAGSEIVFTILSDNYKQLAKVAGVKNTNETPEVQTYLVKKGDTLSAIAKYCGVSVEKLARINKIHNVNMLRVGVKLKIPDGDHNHGYISRYITEQTKKEIMRSVGIENANVKAAIEYSRSHIVLPKGSKSADSEKKSNIIHIKTTSTDKSVVSRIKHAPEKHQTSSGGGAKKISVINDFEPVVKFDPNMEESLKKLVSKYSIDIIKGIIRSAGVHYITITSTLRTVEKQVNAMYDNMHDKGIKSQLDYYRQPGKDVIQAGVNAGGIDVAKKDQVKNAMIDKVKSLQNNGHFVSRHCVSLEFYARHNVFDISKKSLLESLQRAFDKALEKYVKDNPNKMKYISPFKYHGEPAFHVEIIQ